MKQEICNNGRRSISDSRDLCKILAFFTRINGVFAYDLARLSVDRKPIHRIEILDIQHPDRKDA